MANSYIEYIADGTGVIFNLPFGYIDPSHIRIYVDGVETPYTWTNASAIALATAPSEGVTVRVARFTPKEPLVDFQDGEVLTEMDLDNVGLQALFLAQESEDSLGTVMQVGTDGTFSGLDRRIRDLADPVEPQDAVTRSWAETAMTSELVQARAAQSAAKVSETNSKASENASATSQGAARASELAAAASATALAGAEGRAKVSETNAKDSETNAKTSETNSKTSETNAKLSETNSKNSENISKTAEAATKTMEANVLVLEKRARDAAASASAFAAPLGFTFWWQGKRSAIPDGFTPLDGQIGVQDDHAAMWELAKGGAFEVITNAAWLASPYVRGKFATGPDDLTFRFPDMNGVQEGSLKGLFARGDGIGGAIGDLLGDAVRNVTGSSIFRWGAELGGTGVFRSADVTGASGDEVVVTAGNNPRRAINFDLSRSTPTADEIRPVSAIGVWIMRTRGSTFVLEGSKAATLGANVFSGTQAFNAGFTIMGATDQVVRTDVSQSLTAAQKAKARENIGLGQVHQFNTGVRMLSPNNREDLRVQDDGVWGSYSDGLGGWRPLAVGQGGTGATNTAAARNNLGLGNFATQNLNGNTDYVFMGSGYHVFREIVANYLRHNQLGSVCFASTASGGYGPSALISGGALRPAGVSWDGNGGALGGSMGGNGFFSGTWMSLGLADGKPGSREGSTLWIKVGY